MPRTSSRRVFIDALDNIAVGVAEVAGFDVVTISVDLDGAMETLAVAGDDTVRDLFLGRSLSVSEVEKEIANAEDWGDLRFVPHHRLAPTGTLVESQHPHVPHVPTKPQAADNPAAWQPLDLLMAPVYDERDRLRGVLTVDQPRSGLRPSTRDVELLQHYVNQTRRTILFALERVELDDQVRMTEAVRRVVREASADLSVDRIIDYCQEALTETFDASGLWLQTFDDGRDANGTIYSTNGAAIHLKEDLRQVARPAARMLWEMQAVAEVAETMPRSAAMTERQEQQVFEFMRMIDVTSMLFVPLGAGRECLGNLVLTRQHGPKHWTSLEKRTALDIGHDLGRALLNARSFERERQLVEELRELDSYKSRLIATLAHELKNPLTAILGHAELLESAPGLDATARSSVASVERGAARMQQLVEDLLALGKAGDPHLPFEPEPYDLRSGIDEVLDLLRVTVQRKRLDVLLRAPEGPVVVDGERAGLDQVLANLISNATKYTPDGGRIAITLEVVPAQGEAPESVRLSVEDTGIGISAADLPHVFTEFFRSTNPAAVALPGTGLGLAIAKRIVQRHAGELTCASTFGQGTTFVVELPLVC